MKSRHRIAGLAAATALVLAACATGSDTSPSIPSLIDASSNSDGTPTTMTAVDTEMAMREYTECMREHGVDMPDPTVQDGVVTNSVSTDDFEASEGAVEECSPLLEAAFGDFELSPEEQAEFMDQQLAFAKCMRDRGLDWPDPSPDGINMIQFGGDGEFDTEVLNEAMDACSSETFGGSFGVEFSEAGPQG